MYRYESDKTAFLIMDYLKIIKIRLCEMGNGKIKVIFG